DHEYQLADREDERGEDDDNREDQCRDPCMRPSRLCGKTTPALVTAIVKTTTASTSASARIHRPGLECPVRSLTANAPAPARLVYSRCSATPNCGWIARHPISTSSARTIRIPAANRKDMRSVSAEIERAGDHRRYRRGHARAC